MSDRILMINAEIQKGISYIINYELQNPLINGIITVSKVDTSHNLESCKVYISIYDKEKREEVFNQIRHSAGYIRKALCKKLDLRIVPFLTFYLDETADYGERIDETINKINEERKALNDENKE